MSVSIAVVCEAPADKRTGCDLADRVIGEHADWITAEVIDSYRQYRGYRKQDEYLAWTKAKEVAAHRGKRAHGHFDGRPSAADALATRRALLVLKSSPAPPIAVILLRDTDNQLDREAGMNQACDESEQNWGIPIAIGIAHPKRECWALAGFAPQDDEERSRLEELRDGRELGFDPTLASERLTAKRKDAKKSAKRVLAYLTDGDSQREERCWQETPLLDLKSRGQAVGLTAYLQELQDRLVPLFV